MRRDRDEIKCKAYFAQFGQSECVYFTKNETSHKQVFIPKHGPIVAYTTRKYLNCCFIWVRLASCGQKLNKQQTIPFFPASFHE